MTAKGLHPAGLARILKQDRAAITRSLNGQRRWQPEEVPVLAAALGVTEQDIIDKTSGLTFLKSKLKSRSETPTNPDIIVVGGAEKARVEMTLGLREAVGLKHLGSLCVLENAEGFKFIGELLGVYSTGDSDVKTPNGEISRFKIAYASKILGMKLP